MSGPFFSPQHQKLLIVSTIFFGCEAVAQPRVILCVYVRAQRLAGLL